MSHPCVAIIVPVYNTEDYLCQCLDSIITQTYQNLYIILIDDGSTDSSKEIALRYYTKDERIVLIETENGGTSCARNAGLDYLFCKENTKIKKVHAHSSLSLAFAECRYVHFVDSDDWLAPSCIERCVQAALRDDAQIVWHNVQTCDDVIGEIRQGSRLNSCGFIQGRVYSGVQIFASADKHFTWVADGIIDRHFLQEHHLRFVEGVILEDEIFGRQLFALAKRISIITDYLYFYRIRKNSNCQYYACVKDMYEIPIYKKDLAQYFSLPDLNAYFFAYSFAVIANELEDFALRAVKLPAAGGGDFDK